MTWTTYRLNGGMSEKSKNWGARMSLLTYAGAVSPAVYLSFRTNPAPNAHSESNENAYYWVANECLKRWEIVADTGSRVIHITRQAKKKRRLFDEDLNTYISSPISAKDLNDIHAADVAGTLKTHITIDLWYKTFFKRLVEWMTRDVADSHNIANPDDPAPILSTFNHGRRNGKIHVKYKTGKEKLKDIPCLLHGWKVTPDPDGGPPEVRFSINLRIKEELSQAEADKVSIPLIAADYSKIARYARGNFSPWLDDPNIADSGIEKAIKQWELNVFNYMFNRCDLSRGTDFRDDIVGAGIGKSGGTPMEIIKEVRDEIDKHLVTANAWHQPRESKKFEPLQHSLSEVFAAICSQNFRASPVRIIRDMAEVQGAIKKGAEPDISFEEEVAMIFQFGVAHCGEHAWASFSILHKLIGSDPDAKKKLVSVILSGNANIDHQFVVGGWFPRETIETKISNPRNMDSKLGDRLGTKITVFDLRDAIASSGNKEGYVCDPYLSSSSIGQTGARLLSGLNSSRRRKAGKDTDFLSFDDIFPNPGIPAVGKASVKNV
jgi:hypothetical protein